MTCIKLVKDDSCSSNPRRNEGTCFLSGQPEQFNCQCPPDYYGDYCELVAKSITLRINHIVEHRDVVV